ncbi:MAG: LamG domain-containing protein, partial [Bacteroidales bacterium]
MKRMVMVVMSLLCFLSTAKSQNNQVLFWWNFDDSLKTAHAEINSSVPYGNYQTGGLTKYVPGVKGTAIKFDGFSSYIDVIPVKLTNGSDESRLFNLPRKISFEAWVSLGAYPWNWAPILTMGKYKITGFYFGIDSRGRAGIHISDGTSTLHECNSKLNPDTRLGLELKKWYHLVGTYDPEAGLAIYINGKLENTYTDFIDHRRIIYSETEKGFRMGMNREMLAPTDAIREWATFPSRYSLDGIVDEIKIYDKCLTANEIKDIYTSVKPENEPRFDARRFPTVKSSGRFGANYTRLSFYPEWDALWPVGEFNDVVVQFDDSPVKIMFWRGTRYSPCLVSENGKWMADQSRETGNNWFLSQGSRDEMPTGCMEHMSDAQTRSSRVAIIENSEARVVVNWRYLQMDVKFRQNDSPDNTGFGEWGNELYYIYPDGVAVRKVLP